MNTTRLEIFTITLALFALITAACDLNGPAATAGELSGSSDAPTTTTDTVERTKNATDEADGGPITPDWDNWSWTKPEGEFVSEQILTTRSAPKHCGWETVTFIDFGTPLGTPIFTRADLQRFTRDPYGDLNRYAWQITQFDDGAQLPSDAEFSGYVLHGIELWISESKLETEVYMIDGETIEKWPRMDLQVRCA